MGRPGRKSNYVERKLANLADMSVEWAIRRFPDFTNEQKLKILTMIGSKFISQDVEHSGEVVHTHTIEHIDVEERANQLLEERSFVQ